MRWAHFLLFILATTFAKEEDINEVKPPINLDANLRRALLKALTELENEDNAKTQPQSKEKLFQKASASALSFFASTETSPTEETIFTTTPESTHKPIVVIQKSLQSKPITSIEKEQIQTSASSSFTSSLTKSEKINKNSVFSNFKTSPKPVKNSKVETTTVAVIPSTEESEAKVEDVQFFSAPLVAAFTVHQDETGLPKSVEPIYRPKTEPKPQEPQTTQQPFARQQDQIRQQLALQEKQRALEAEITRLRQQQQQQNYLIRQQQIYHQQQLQLQKQKILDEQTRIFQSRQPFLPTVTPNFQPTTPRTNFTPNPNRGNLVSFQPSISFTSHQHPSGVLPLNAQQLPVKGATDFRSAFNPTNNFQQLNYLSHQQPPPENSVSNYNFLPTVEPQLTLTAPKQHHRVFRQETNTGNFFNNRYNQFNQFPPHHNRFFRSNVETIRSTPLNYQVQPPVVNQQLNHLLYNSGLIRGKQQEDLNIVSKVLALNHYGGDYRFGGSSISEQRLLAPAVIKKV